MDSNIIVAVLSLVGTGLGTLGGIVASSKLTAHRLEALEKKVEQHNGLASKLVAVEQRAKSNTHRLDNAGL
jgi:hypothetical protein